MTDLPVELTRRVEVPLRRLDAWLAGFRRRHPEVVVERLAESDGGSHWLLRAGDGERAVIDVPAWLSATVDADRLAGRLVVNGGGMAGGSPGTGSQGTGTADRAAPSEQPEPEDPTIAVLLVRRAGYAVAVFHGSEQVVAKVGTRHIHGRTAAGGWSQQRYARRRANQADELVSAVAGTFATIIGPHAPFLAALVTGGDRAMLAHVRGAVEPALARALADVPEVRLGIGAPTAAVLAGVPDRALTVLVHLSENASTENVHPESVHPESVHPENVHTESDRTGGRRD